MLLSPVISHVRAWCPAFGKRVAGALDFDVAMSSARMDVPCAWVVVTDDKPDASRSSTDVLQDIEDQFDVVVAIRNEDERGQAAGDVIHRLRAELLRALSGWEPSAEHDAIQYRGGSLLAMNRHHVLYRFSWSAQWQLGSGMMGAGDQPPETWPEVERAGLPGFAGVDVGVDVIDPMVDKNLSETGPDGRIEMDLKVEVSDVVETG